jgi:hypothetical protein
MGITGCRDGKVGEVVEGGAAVAEVQQEWRRRLAVDGVVVLRS